MTAEEIRRWPIRSVMESMYDEKGDLVKTPLWLHMLSNTNDLLREIAAQLAEIKTTLRS